MSLDVLDYTKAADIMEEFREGGFDPCIGDFLLCLLHEDPKRRMKAAALLTQKFIKNSKMEDEEVSETQVGCSQA